MRGINILRVRLGRCARMMQMAAMLFGAFGAAALSLSLIEREPQAG